MIELVQKFIQKQTLEFAEELERKSLQVIRQLTYINNTMTKG